MSWSYNEHGNLVQIRNAEGETLATVDHVTGVVSDGFHTFEELYRYRLLYNAAFFNLAGTVLGNLLRVHKSWYHSDGEPCFGGGWFVVMATLPTGQISNHYEADYWDLFNVPEQERADEYDGHTPGEAADRLQRFLELR